jgi:PD-(D/E)XK nuclease superfamily
MNEVSNLTTHPLRLVSFSSLGTLHSCPRRFELDRIGSQTLAQPPARTETVHTGYGSAFGAGLQSLLSGHSLAKAKLEAITNYRYSNIYPEAYADEKSLFHCLNSLTRFCETELTELTTDWEALIVDGKPASEISFAIKYPNNFYDRGFIDFILQHKVTKQILVVEIKTEGGYAPKNPEAAEAKYKNSNQGNGYALVADYLADKLGVENEISVVYIVHRTKTNSFEPYVFPKPPEARLRFIKDRLAELGGLEFLIERATDTLSPEPFPMFGNCTTYGSVCQYYGICELKQDYSKVQDVSIGEFNLLVDVKDLLNLQHKRLTSTANLSTNGELYV